MGRRFFTSVLACKNSLLSGSMPFAVSACEYAATESNSVSSKSRMIPDFFMPISVFKCSCLFGKVLANFRQGNCLQIPYWLDEKCAKSVRLEFSKKCQLLAAVLEGCLTSGAAASKLRRRSGRGWMPNTDCIFLSLTLPRNDDERSAFGVRFARYNPQRSRKFRGRVNTRKMQPALRRSEGNWQRCFAAHESAQSTRLQKSEAC